MNQTVQIDLSLLLPTMDKADECVNLITTQLSNHKGVEKAHIVRENGTAQLCLHFDPNLITLDVVQRLAQTAGAVISERYHHEQIPFVGLVTADAALNLEKVLQGLAGMLHASVNYAAGLIFVAYDSTVLSRDQIEQTIRNRGARIVSEIRPSTAPAAHAHEGHDHGSAPAFLPHWMQERWMLLLIVLAALFFLTGWIGIRYPGFSPLVARVLFGLTYLAAGYDVAAHAIPALLKGKLDTDILMLAAAAGAAILGQFEEGAFLLLLFSIGHAGEHYALDRARNAIHALGALMPRLAVVRRSDQLVEVPVEAVQIDEIVIARPGDRIAVDGIVACGRSSVDQSPITGESVPIAKTTGSVVFAGTVNHECALEIRVTRTAGDNTLSRVMKLVAEAQSQQSPTQQFADRLASRFVPGVFFATLLLIGLPPILGWLPLADSFYRGMLLLVAASPCALAIGTPATVLAGIAQAARNGVLIKGGVHLENLGRLRAIAFDKTGTITRGTFSVTDTLPARGVSCEELLRVAAAVEQQSNHPLAQAVVRAAHAKDLQLPHAEGLENLVGRGVRSQIDGQPVLVGSLKLFQDTPGFAPHDTLVRQVDDLEKKGRSAMVVNRGGQFLGVLGLADTPRENAAQVMQALQQLGIEHLVMLTGDNDAVARQIAAQVGLTEARADLMPEDKLTAIRQLEDTYQSIAMIGDGVNDTPALATATVGIAMGGAGTAVALETADVALMADDLGKLPFAVGLSRVSRRIIQQNLLISLGMIGLLILTSVFNVVPLGGAVVLHEGSTIAVVLNALRLLIYQQRD